ncbi:MAG: hypothetical protein JXR76_17015 [Deltaproteobacteria bacterium]|nr:hypothetical protein [Deltaproteobacteria bacterium]
MGNEAIQEKSLISVGVALCLLLSIWIFGASALASTQGPSAKPVVIVFSGTASEGRSAMEEQFIVSLQLALDRFSVREVDVSHEPFTSLPLSERLEVIGQHTAVYDAVASVWIEQTNRQQVLLHLVAIGTGRALVRIIEAKNSPSAAEELAFAAQELLGEAYLFEQTPSSPQLAYAVNRVKETIQIPPETPLSRVALIALFTLSRSIAGHIGPSLYLGGGMDVFVPLGSRFFVRFGAGGSSGPNASFADGNLTTRGGYIRAMAGFRSQLWMLSIGPYVGMSATCQFVTLRLGEGKEQKATRAGFRGDMGVQLTFPVTANMHIFADGAVGGYAIRNRYRRLSDNSVVVMSPFVDWRASLGFLFAIW